MCYQSAIQNSLASDDQVRQNVPPRQVLLGSSRERINDNYNSIFCHLAIMITAHSLKRSWFKKKAVALNGKGRAVKAPSVRFGTTWFVCALNVAISAEFSCFFNIVKIWRQ